MAEKKNMNDPRSKNVDFGTVPPNGFEATLRTLVNSDGWHTMQTKRDKLFIAAKQACVSGKVQQMNVLMDQIGKHDEKMAKVMFYSVLEFAYDIYKGSKSKFLSQKSFHEEYVKTPEQEKQYIRYQEEWFKTLFLLDVVDSYVTSAESALTAISGDMKFSTHEFDDIKEVQKIIKSHNYQARRYVHQDICDLQNGFIDSIQEFVDSQMDTYMPSLAMLREELKRKGEIKDGYDDIAKNKTLDR